MKNFSLVSYSTWEEFKKIRKIQKELSKITGSKKCLEDWLPHITIGDWISVKDSELEKLELDIINVLNKQKVIYTKVNWFWGIDNWKGAVEWKITPYVIWLNIEINPELLTLFNLSQKSFTDKYDLWLPKTIEYVPHITLAFADLTKEGYELGMKYLSEKEINIILPITHLSLTECYGVGNMESVEYKKFYFSKN